MEDYTNTWVTLTSSTSLTPDTWYNVVMVRDSTVGKQIYINGVLDTSASYSSVTPLGDIRIGADYYNGNIIQTFDGQIDDVKIWNRALTSTEISDVYGGSSVTSGLVTHYNFDQTSGNLLDQVGSNDATNNGATHTTGQISATNSIISATSLADNTSSPQHYTFTRDGNDWEIYQNGVSEATATDSTSLGASILTITGSTNAVTYANDIRAPATWALWQGGASASTPTTGQTDAVIGNSMHFNGSTDMIGEDILTAPTVTQGSVSMWVKPEATGASSGNPFGGVGFQSYWVQNGQWAPTYPTNSFNAGSLYSNANVYTMNDWNHWVITIDSSTSNNETTVYIDGQVVPMFDYPSGTGGGSSNNQNSKTKKQ